MPAIDCRRGLCSSAALCHSLDKCYLSLPPLTGPTPITDARVEYEGEYIAIRQVVSADTCRQLERILAMVQAYPFLPSSLAARLEHEVARLRV